MPVSQTQSEYDRNIRTAYVAIDAIQRLQDRGFGNERTERALESIRYVISAIEEIPIRDARKQDA